MTSPRRLHLGVLLTVAMLLAATGAWAQDEVDDPPHAVEFVPIPVVFYTPETSFGFGASGIMLFRLPGESPTSRASQFSGVGFYTLENQYLFSVGPKIYFRDEGFFLDLNVAYLKFPTKFHGLGKATDLDDEEVFTYTEAKFGFDFLSRVWKRLYLGPAYRFSQVEMLETEDNGFIATNELSGDQGGTMSTAGGAINWDSRENGFAPRHGSFYRLVALAGDEHLGSDFNFNRFEFDLRHYVPLFERHALALQAYSEILTGEPPFYELAKLGGSVRLRGIYEGRYRDRASLVLQSEYRFPIYWRFSGVVFTGLGGVEERFNFLHFGDFHYSYGGGLRFRVTKKDPLNIRLDYGRSEDDSGFYVVFGEAF